MLVVREHEAIKHVLEELEKAGFGFSVMEDPADDEPFVVDSYVDVLRDFGWAGREAESPGWLGAA